MVTIAREKEARGKREEGRGKMVDGREQVKRDVKAIRASKQGCVRVGLTTFKIREVACQHVKS